MHFGARSPGAREVDILASFVQLSRLEIIQDAWRILNELGGTLVI
jgi:hypothetical protein